MLQGVLQTAQADSNGDQAHSPPDALRHTPPGRPPPQEGQRVPVHGARHRQHHGGPELSRGRADHQEEAGRRVLAAGVLLSGRPWTGEGAAGSTGAAGRALPLRRERPSHYEHCDRQEPGEGGH